MTRHAKPHLVVLSVIAPVVLVLALTPAAQRLAPQPEPDAIEFNIFGLVESPGAYAWTEGMTVRQAVALAGGYTEGGSKDELQIQRLIEGRLTSIVVVEDDLVQPDDVIMVRARRY
jgi:protein involved in polysaccharide export with SLBB domain